MTVSTLLHALIDLPPDYCGHPTRDALVQLTLDGEHFFVIDSLDDIGEGGVVARLVRAGEGE